MEEKVEVVFIFGSSNRCYRETVRRFNAVHAERPISLSYVQHLIRKFVSTGSVTNAKKSGRPAVRTEELQEHVLAEVAVKPQQSIRELSLTCDASRMTVQRILKLHKFHPFKLQIHQELTEHDPDNRLEFCEIMTERINNNTISVKNVCFSDESSFSLHGLVNRHNCRYWSDENPHEFRELNTQYPQKVNVWAGILGDHIIGPMFIPGNLTGELYHEMLTDLIVPLITDIVENNEDEFDDDAAIVFQQDGCPAHYFRRVRDYLDEAFPGQWIGRRGSIEWPARSPDLSPLDFFLWGHLKSVVFRTKPNDIEELKRRITDACHQITPETLQSVRQQFEQRLYFCQEVGGAHFEHLT